MSSSERITKSSNVQTLLMTTDLSAWDIADIAGCHPDLVRKIRRQMRMPFDREATKTRFARLEQDLRDLRAMVRSLQSFQRLNPDGVSFDAS